MNPQQLTAVSINQLESKVKSKKELYQFLVHDCQAYLPPIQSTNVYFLKGIMRGSKEYLRRDKAMVAAVPQIEGLTVEDLLKYSQQNQAVLKHLPDQRDWVHVDRKWVCDIIYSIDKQGFQQFINLAVKKRKDRLDVSQNLIVEMKPEFASALQSCMTYSSQHGRAASLIKSTSKRKRSRKELEEVKDMEDMLKKDRQGFLQRAKRLKDDAQVNAQAMDQAPIQQMQPQPSKPGQAMKQGAGPFNI